MGRGQECKRPTMHRQLPTTKNLIRNMPTNGVVPHDRTVGERLKGGDRRKLWSTLGSHHSLLSMALSLLRPEDASFQVGSGERAQEQS